MFWFIVVVTAGLVIGVWAFFDRRSRKKHRYRGFSDHLSGWFIGWCFFAAAFVIAGTAVTASFKYKANDVENSYFYLQEATAQRDAIILEFDDILSNEDYIQLMNAAIPADVAFLKNNPEVTGFLLGRADRIVEINSRLFSIRNEILADAKEVCNVVQSPLIPQLPIYTPECRLGDIIQLTDPSTINVDE
jgi:hypothetical protein